MQNNILAKLSELHQKNVAYVVATVVEVVGSTSAKTGSKILIDETGVVITGWVGGGCAESTVCAEALDSLASGQPSTIDIDMDDEVLGAGMPCGGHMRVFVEPIMPKPVVWIMGHGEVAEQLCELAYVAGFIVKVNDPGAIAEKFPHAVELVTDDLDYTQLQPATDDYVVIATQHKGDHESMAQALSSGANYIALIASRKRSRLVLDYLRAQGYSPSELEKVVAPCGLDLNAKTPVEIALSVLAEIVLLRRGGSGARMKDLLHQAGGSGKHSSELPQRLQPHG